MMNEMKQEVFISTRFLEDAIFKRLKNCNGETINCFFGKLILPNFYKISMDKNAKLKIRLWIYYDLHNYFSQ